MSDPLRLYTTQEWEAMSEHDREVLREHRRRTVERERQRHERRRALLESLTAERFSRDG
jgi:hypothetical protein